MPSCRWGYEVARAEFGATEKDGGPWLAFKNPVTGREIVIKDVIADNFLQQILLRPEDYDVIATLNLNGDYISDALAAQVGGIGIAPGGNIGDGVGVFEATHGTAPGFAGKNRVNPGSLILSAEMMLRYMGWTEAADLIIKGVAGAIANGELTFDLARLRTAIRAPETQSQDARQERGRAGTRETGSRRTAGRHARFRQGRHPPHARLKRGCERFLTGIAAPARGSPAFLDDVNERHPDYYCRPVPPFGATDARFLIVGLAPGMHGANRTGRPFTGDHAGILLYRMLHKYGFSFP